MLALLCAVFSTTWAETKTGTITFGSGSGATSINQAIVTGDDSQGNTWTITTVGTTSYTPNSGYAQVGSSNKPATSITFTTTLAAEQNITSFEAKFGGFNGTAGTVTLKVGDTTVGSGSLNASNDVIVSSTSSAQGTVLTITVTGISKGVKCYYISYTYEEGDQPQPTGETYEIILGNQTLVEGDYIIYYGGKAMTNIVDNNKLSSKEPSMDGNGNIITDDNTMVWHIAPQGDYWTIQSLDNGQYAASTGNDNEATMTTTLDDKALWSVSGSYGFVNKWNANNGKFANLQFGQNSFSCSLSGSGIFTLYRMPDKYYVAGTWTDWATNKIEMTKNTDGTYSLDDQELAVDASFKIIKIVSTAGSPIWCGGNADGEYYWVTADNHTDLSLNVGGGQNFQIKNAGTWTFTVDPTGDTPKLTVSGNWPEWEYYLYGDFNDWATTDSYIFDNVGNGKYTLNKPIQLGETFKIKGIRGSEEKWFGAVSNGDFYVEESWVGTPLSLATPGENFYMNLSNKKDYWELEFDPTNMTLVLSNFVSDVAKLPFEFDGGRNAIQNTAGLTTTGLGTDYNNSPKLKFSDTNNALILHFDERPGKLTFDILGNTLSGNYEFVVQTSVDGENYTDLQSYTSISGSVQSEEFTNLGENVRYIKWLYKQKSSGNVALGNIVLEKYVAPEYHTLSINPVENAEIFVFYNDPDNIYPAIEDGDEVLSGSEVMVSVSAEEGFDIKSLTVTDEDGETVTLTEEEMGISWIFTMPKSDVTISCTVEEKNYDIEEWVLTPLAELTEDDIFVIVGNNGQYYAMSNDNGTTAAPAAVSVRVSGEGNERRIFGTPNPLPNNLKWNVKSDDNGYIFYPNGDDENYLYATNTNKGMFVGTGDAKHFTLSDEGYLTTTETTQQRFVGIYSGSSDWRCYTSTSTNISGQTFGFYKYVKPETFEFSINALATDGTDCYATISALGEGNWKVVGDVEVSTVVVENDQLTYPKVFENGDLIPGDGAFLVKGAAGDYAFEKSKSPRTFDLGDNMLMSTGEGKFFTEAPADAGNTPYLFYKLARNASSDDNSVGFYFGGENGAAFTYEKGHQAYLAVPNPTGSTPVQSFSFDGSTGITDMEVVHNNQNEVYTLSGVRINNNQLTKGVYIVNGKKVIIK